EIVVGRVGEGAASVAVAQCVYVGLAGAQFVVDGDMAAFVGLYAGPVETEIVGVGAAADGEKHMGPGNGRIAFGAIDVDRDPTFVRRERNTFGIEAEGDVLFLEDRPDGVRY